MPEPASIRRPAGTLLTAALTTAARGWPVFPLRPGDKRPALHGETRCPRTGPCTRAHLGWEARATTDTARIQRAWSTGEFNIGLATGAARLLIVDLDTLKNDDDESLPGAAAFTLLCVREKIALPQTFTVVTPSGGRHLYFRATVAVPLRNSAGLLAPHIDTRGSGGYVVAPGSHTPTGPYTVLHDVPPARLPDRLCQLLAPPTGPRVVPAVPTARSASRYAGAALANESAAVRTAREGGRNAALLRAARALGRLVSSGDLPREQVTTALQAAGEAAGLPAAECRATVSSGLTWSIAHNPQAKAAA